MEKQWNILQPSYTHVVRFGASVAFLGTYSPGCWTADGVIPFPVTRGGKWIEECVYFWDDLTSLFDDNNIPIGERYFAFTTFHLVDEWLGEEADEDTETESA